MIRLYLKVYQILLHYMKDLFANDDEYLDMKRCNLYIE